MIRLPMDVLEVYKSVHAKTAVEQAVELQGTFLDWGALFHDVGR